MTSLAQRTAKNSFYGFLSYAVPIAFTIVLTPLIIHRLGVEHYGLFVLTSVIAGFFSLFKFGLGYGISKIVSQYHGDPAQEGVSEIISSTLVLFTLIGLAGLGMTMLVAHFGLSQLNISPNQQIDAQIMFQLSGVAFFFSSINSTFTNAIAAMQRLDIYTKIYLGGMTTLNVSMALLVISGFGIVSLVAAQAATSALLFFGYYIATRRLLPNIAIRLKYTHATFKKFISLNAYAYLHEAATTLLFEFDKVVVATVAGPAAVSYYSIAGTIGQKVQGTIGSLTSIAMPISSSLTATAEHARVAQIYQRAMSVTFCVASGLTIAVIGFGPAILRYWVGSDFERESLSAVYILAITYFLLAIFTVLGHFVLGLGQVKRLARYTAVFAGLNLILRFMLLPKFGITGAAWAYLLCLIPLPFFILTTEREVFHITTSRLFYLRQLYAVLTMAVIGLITARILTLTVVHSFISVALTGALWLIGYAILYKKLGFVSPENWQLIIDSLRRLIKK